MKRKHQKINNSQSKRTYGIRVAARDIRIRNDYISTFFIRIQRISAGHLDIILPAFVVAPQLSGKHALWFQMIKLFVSSFVQIYLTCRVRFDVVKTIEVPNEILTRDSLWVFCYLELNENEKKVTAKGSCFPILYTEMVFCVIWN